MMLSPKEIEFLAHRLAVPDALTDVVRDSEDEALSRATLDEVEAACRWLSDAISHRPIPAIVAELTPLQEFCLRDAVEGSTYVAVNSNDMPERADMGRAIRVSAIRAARTTVFKLRAAGFTVDDAPEY